MIVAFGIVNFKYTFKLIFLLFKEWKFKKKEKILSEVGIEPGLGAQK